MSLSDLASLGSFVNGFGVLASLVFLYFQVRQVNAQVRQAERNQQAMITQARTTRSIDIRMRWMEPNFAAAGLRVSRGDPDVTEVEILQFTNYAWSLFLHWEDSFYQHQSGLMGEQAYQSAFSLTRGALGSAPMRVAWRRARSFFEPDYRASIDQVVAEAPAVRSASDERPGEWQALVASELGAVSAPE